ncbi:10271_t:CDS:2 [Entrophospora sp. SA101]|nr:10271_t:CDS:2 [Entrophospora sp. SA101]
MAISNLKALAYNILKEFKEPIVDGMDIPKLGQCPECNKKIFSSPHIKSFTTLQCGHAFHRLCLENKILLDYLNVYPYPNCNEKLEIIDYTRHDSQLSGVSSIVGNLGKNLQIDPLESVDEIMNEDSNENSNEEVKGVIEVSENTNNFLYHYRKILHAESKHIIANREVIKCYYNFGVAIKKCFDHYRNLKHGEHACLALVNDEIRKQLPNDIANDALKKTKERAGKIYDLFVSIGHYPENYKTTRGSSHPIPDNYKIKTTFVKNTITCSINYNENNDPVYRIDWVDDVNKFNVISIKSATEAVDLFLKCLKDYREQNPPKEKHIRKKIDSFDNLSTSTQRSRVISMGQSIVQTFENKEAIVKVLDEHNIGRDSYRALTAIVNSLPHEHNIEKKKKRINQIITEKIPIFTFNTSFEKTVKSVTNDMDIDDDTEEEISENILVTEESRGNGV